MRHGDSLLEADVGLSPEEARSLMGEPVIVELDYDELLCCRVLAPGDSHPSGIRAEPACDAIRVVGTVHMQMDVGEGIRIYDVYVQEGPEFISITSEALGDISLQIGSTVELTFLGLRFYPTNY